MKIRVNYFQFLVKSKNYILSIFPRVFLRYLLLGSIWFFSLFVILELSDMKLNEDEENEIYVNVDPTVMSKTIPTKVKKATLKSFPKEITIPFYPKDAEWQDVSDGFRVFSAFYDGRTPSDPFIRIIAATNKSTMPTWCLLWYNISDLNTMEERNFAYVKAMKETGDAMSGEMNTYATLLVTCPIKNKIVPLYVSLKTSQEKWPHNVLVVHNTENFLLSRRSIVDFKHDRSASNTNNFITVDSSLQFGDSKMITESQSIVLCVKLPHLISGKVMNLMEFLELYLLLGVQHFLLYTPLLSEEEAKCLFNTYLTKGIITVLPWIDNSTVFEAKDAADYDCVYRTMYAYNYTVLVDMNEFILPRKHDTLQQLLADLVRAEENASVSGFLFSKATFYLHWSNEEQLETSPFDVFQNGLITVVKTRRSRILTSHKEYILVPERVTTLERRFYRKSPSRYPRLRVSPEIAILHQYRECKYYGYSCQMIASIVDKTALRFRDRLTSAVRKRYRSRTCPLPYFLQKSSSNYTNGASRTKHALSEILGFLLQLLTLTKIHCKITKYISSVMN